MLGAALHYAARGWPVFPLEPKGKRPLGALVAHGLLDATTDVGTIRSWWSRIPSANVGIRTGVVSDLIVLDVDGELGMESMATLLSLHGDFPVLAVRTGSSGLHVYFQYPKGLEISNSAGKLGRGLDVRGDGGYVVAPPSVHPNGHSYSWNCHESVQAPEMPNWLADLLQRDPRPSSQQHRPAQGRRMFAGSAQRLALVELERLARLVARAPEGARNNRLNVAAYYAAPFIQAGLLGYDEVDHVLTQAARAAGLDEREIAATIASGLAAGQRKLPPLEMIG